MESGASNAKSLACTTATCVAGSKLPRDAGAAFGAPACATFVVSGFAASFELHAHSVVATAIAIDATNRDMGPRKGVGVDGISNIQQPARGIGACQSVAREQAM